jgi:hypothetical protein
MHRRGLGQQINGRQIDGHQQKQQDSFRDDHISPFEIDHPEIDG